MFTVFAPRLSRALWFSLWMLISSLPIYVVSTLGHHSRLAEVVSFGFVAPALTAIGFIQSIRMRLQISPREVSYRNILTRHCFSWEDVAEITLKRFGSRATVEHEAASLRPLALTIYGLRLPAIAIRLKHGEVSPAISITMLIAKRSRQALLEIFAREAPTHGVLVRILKPNRGWLFGTLWDIRRGYGIDPSQNTFGQ